MIINKMRSTGDKVPMMVLIFINMLFIVAGLGLFVLGMIMRFAFEQLAGDRIRALLQIDQRAKETILDSFNTGIHAVAIGLIILGAIIFAIALLGCVGACCHNKCVLIIYSSLMIAILIAMVVLIALFFTKKEEIDYVLKDGLRANLAEHYKGVKGQHVFNVAWNAAFMELDCCGVDNYQDLMDLKWTRKISAAGRTINQVIPITCCKVDGTFPDYKWKAKDVRCSEKPTSENSNRDSGCYERLNDMIKTYSNIIVAVLAIVMVLQVIVICCALWLCYSSRARFV